MKDHEKITGNARFQGFAVDLIQRIAEMHQFTYELYLVPDGNFGAKTKNKTWNGMIGEVLSGASIPIFLQTSKNKKSCMKKLRNQMEFSSYKC